KSRRYAMRTSSTAGEHETPTYRLTDVLPFGCASDGLTVRASAITTAAAVAPVRSRRLAEKERIGRVVRLVAVSVADAVERLVEAGAVRLGDLDSREDPAERGAVVAVVKERDRPAAAQLAQERQERARALGELEAGEAFAAEAARPPADHEADVHLGHLVVREVDDRVTVRPDRLDQGSALGAAASKPDADEEIGHVGIAVPVVELGDRQPAEDLAETT